jgi:hypothetical protein
MTPATSASATCKANGTHSVYVVRLSRKVLGKTKFARANPERDPDKPCLYVGLTGLTPRERFANHKSGYKASRWVRDYGIELLPEIYSDLNPMPYDQAQRMEEALAEELREQGYAVWQK